MIIFDNSILSAFTRLRLLPTLKKLVRTAIISNEIFQEYSSKWQKKIPKWIDIVEVNKEIVLENIPVSLSNSDLSIIRLAIERKMLLASDDLPLRDYAKKLGIAITGSLGLLKALYQKHFIKEREKYVKLLYSLQEDIYISDELMKWALEE
jgi:predicted nucleic acid-binding protein